MHIVRKMYIFACLYQEKNNLTNRLISRLQFRIQNRQYSAKLYQENNKSVGLINLTLFLFCFFRFRLCISDAICWSLVGFQLYWVKSVHNLKI